MDTFVDTDQKEDPLAGLSIQVIEGSEHLCGVLTILLDAMGAANVMVAHNTRTGFRDIKKFLPDLLIVNADLPDQAGYQLVRTLRCHTDSPDRHIPILLVTNEDTPTFRHNALECGADAFVDTPISPEKLYEALVYTFLYASPAPALSGEPTARVMSEKGGINAPTIH